MSFSTLFLFVLILACPLSMMLMMRGGGHGGHAMHGSGGAAGDPAAQEQRIVDLEGEVARLGGSSAGSETRELTTVSGDRRP